MIFDFMFILTALTLITGLIALVDKLFWAKKRIALPKDEQKTPFLIDNARSLFPVFFAVLVIRSFIAQPFWVPSESLEPTLMPGDFLLVTQYDYGLRLPVWHKKVIGTQTPKRGDIVVFRWPVNPKLDLVKRVIGQPGDRISYVDKVLYINGKAAQQKFIGDATASDSKGFQWPVKKYQEEIDGKQHFVYVRADRKSDNFYNLTVPKGMYFMMGDNRDDSDDSRSWGFMPDEAIIGKVRFVFMSWARDHFSLQWRRIGKVS